MEQNEAQSRLEEKARRNLNPHKEAVLSMNLWSAEYAEQRGGSMDFWDKLDEYRKRRCRDIVDRLEQAQARDKVAYELDRNRP